MPYNRVRRWYGCSALYPRTDGERLHLGQPTPAEPCVAGELRHRVCRLQERLVQGGHVGKPGLESHGGDPKMSGQAPHQAIAEQVKLAGIMDQLPQGDHPGIRDR